MSKTRRVCNSKRSNSKRSNSKRSNRHHFRRKAIKGGEEKDCSKLKNPEKDECNRKTKLKEKRAVLFNRIDEIKTQERSIEDQLTELYKITDKESSNYKRQVKLCEATLLKLAKSKGELDKSETITWNKIKDIENREEEARGRERVERNYNYRLEQDNAARRDEKENMNFRYNDYFE